MKNLKPSKLFTLLLLTFVVAVLGLISKSEKQGLSKTLSKSFIPSALADTPSAGCAGEADCCECGSTY